MPGIKIHWSFFLGSEMLVLILLATKHLGTGIVLEAQLECEGSVRGFLNFIFTLERKQVISSYLIYLFIYLLNNHWWYTHCMPGLVPGVL